VVRKGPGAVTGPGDDSRWDGLCWTGRCRRTGPSRRGPQRAVAGDPPDLGALICQQRHTEPDREALRRDELVAYGKIAGTQAIVGLAVFFFWPTTTPMTAGADWTRYPAFAWLKTVDASGNACPSLHVAFAIFSGVCLDRIFREMHSSWSLRALSVCWCLSIVYSTISTRQHVSVDVAGGAALGLLTALIGPRLIKTRIEE